MPAQELKIGNRIAYLRKAIGTPNFKSERVLARDSFEFTELYLKRKCPGALPFWEQARSYFKASKSLPATSSPLTSYYSFLNGAKALLMVKGISASPAHGVSGSFAASKRSLQNEIIKFKNSGVLSELTKYLKETEPATTHNLTDILSNLPFIHRAYRYTFRSHPERFVPIRNVVYRKKAKSNYIYLSADIEGWFSNPRSLTTLPATFEVDEGDPPKSGVRIRTKKDVEWYGKGASVPAINAATTRLFNYHAKHRRNLVYIASSPDLWYLKRDVSGSVPIDRYNMTLIFAAMHRLSELSRYDPKGLQAYLDGKENWLLTEFIELAPLQFFDELVCEMTSLEFATPGVRPRAG